MERIVQENTNTMKRAASVHVWVEGEGEKGKTRGVLWE